MRRVGWRVHYGWRHSLWAVGTERQWCAVIRRCEPVNHSHHALNNTQNTITIYHHCFHTNYHQALTWPSKHCLRCFRYISQNVLHHLAAPSVRLNKLNKQRLFHQKLIQCYHMVLRIFIDYRLRQIEKNWLQVLAAIFLNFPHNFFRALGCRRRRSSTTSLSSWSRWHGTSKRSPRSWRVF